MRLAPFVSTIIGTMIMASCVKPYLENDTDANELTSANMAIKEFIGSEMYGEGAFVILDVATEALREKHAAGEATMVGLEDLWAHALQEGLILFNDPERRWGITSSVETSDMIGQTTIGPWQMTIWNIRDHYGPRYGVKPEWTDGEVYTWARANPVIQGKMIADYIQLSYEDYGRRSPYAIQRYFWLEPYVTGEIGQSSDWSKSPVAKPPVGGTWQDLTPAMKRDTGFYAKQVLMGTHYTKSGLLFWLLVTGKEEEAREVIATWRHQKKVILDEGDYILTEEPGGFQLSTEDVKFADHSPAIAERMRQLIGETP